MIDSLRPYKGLAVKKIVLVMILLSALGSLVACSEEIPATALEGPVTEEPYRPTLSPKPDWLVRWLNEPVCQPPCWEKITPGKTSFADAQVIAKRISGFEVEAVGVAFIRLNFNQYGTNYFANILSRGEENVQVIALDTTYTLLELGEIVDAYGFPDEMLKYSVYGEEFNSHSIDLLYYDLGMAISFTPLLDESSNNINLNPNIKVGAILFYAPQLENYFSVPPQYGTNVSLAIKLNGYGDYDLPEGVLYP